MKYTKHNRTWYINKLNSKTWYICGKSEGWDGTIKSSELYHYLHSDGKEYDYCGFEGFFKTELEAKQVLHKYFFPIHIPDELFEL